MKTWVGRIAFKQSISRLFSKNVSFSVYELQNTRIGAAEEDVKETIHCLWPFLSFARFIGMCPVIRRRRTLFVAKYTHPTWIITFVVFITQLILLGETILSLREAETTADGVLLFNDVVYYTHTLMNGIYMAWNIKSVPIFIFACTQIEKILKKYTGMTNSKRAKDHLARDCFLLFLFLTSGQLVSNLLYFVSVAHREDVTTITEYFRAFTSDSDSGGIGAGNIYSGLFFLIGEWNCDFGWNFTDILLALLSVLIGRFFRRLNHVLGNRKMALSLTQIEELRCDHKDICNLVEICNSIFAPLFLLTFVGNVGYLFTRLYSGISDGLEDPLAIVRAESLYALWYQILLKILFPTYLAARLNEEASEGLKFIQKWPSALGTPDCKLRLLLINRFVTQIASTPVGISGCGFFLITKSFMVTLISAIVTYEVIILQFQGTTIK